MLVPLPLTDYVSHFQPHSNAGGQIANELPFPMGPSLEMSLDEHLRPLPTPPIWLSQDPFRLGQVW